MSTNACAASRNKAMQPSRHCRLVGGPDSLTAWAAEPQEGVKCHPTDLVCLRNPDNKLSQPPGNSGIEWAGYRATVMAAVTWRQRPHDVVTARRVW